MADSTGPERRKPSEWEPVVGRKIHDPDGWRSGVPHYPGAKDWEEPITLAEFHARSAMSTVGPYEQVDAQLRLPSEWEKIFRLTVKDPDGWRSGVDGYPDPKGWDVPITHDEFNARMTVSTVDVRERYRRQEATPTS
jgi:hypothetical protein